MIEKRRKIIYLLSAITLLLNGYSVIFRKMIIMSTDELGPISIAAFWSGNDWSSTVSKIPYYSYGYSFLLYPLYNIFHEPESFFKAAIVLNAIMAVCIFLIAYYICGRLIRDDLCKYLIAFLCANNTVTLARSSSAWCEMALTFLNWVILFVLVLYLNSKKNIYIYLLSILAVGIYCTHQRMLGVTVGLSIFLCSLLYVERKYKEIIVYFILVSSFFVIHRHIKEILIKNIWLGSKVSNINNSYRDTILHAISTGENSGNELLGLLLFCLILCGIIISFVFSKKRVFVGFTLSAVIATVLCLVYYRTFGGRLWIAFSSQICIFGISTFGIGIVAFLLFIEQLYKIKTDRDVLDNGFLISMYFWVIFILSLALVAFSLNKNMDPNNIHRADFLFYSRYLEPLYGIAVLLMVTFIGKKIPISRLMIAMSTFIVFICGLTCFHYYRWFTEKRHNLHNSIELVAFYKNEHYSLMLPFLFLCVGVIAILVFNLKKTCMIILILISIYSSNIYIHEVIVPFENSYYQIKDIVEEYQRLEGDNIIYWFGEGMDDNQYPLEESFMRFLFRDATIVECDRIQHDQKWDYCLTNSLDYLLSNGQGYVLDRKGGVFLFKKQNEVNNEIALDKSIFNFIDQSSWPEGQNSGLIMYGPYITLEQGNYKLRLDYNSRSAISQSTFEDSFIEIFSGISGNVYATGKLDTNEENGQVEVSFSLSEKTNNIEFRISALKGQEIDINGINLEKK